MCRRDHAGETETSVHAKGRRPEAPPFFEHRGVNRVSAFQRSGWVFSAILIFLKVGACTLIASAESVAALVRGSIDFTAPSTLLSARSISAAVGTRDALFSRTGPQFEPGV